MRASNASRGITEKRKEMHDKVEEEEIKGQRKKIISRCLNALT